MATGGMEFPAGEQTEQVQNVAHLLGPHSCPAPILSSGDTDIKRIRPAP